MTPAAPTWGDVEAFLSADGWRQVEKGERGGSRSRHVFYEKILDDGRVLQTHISHSRGKTLNPHGTWVTQQARNLVMQLGEQERPMRLLIPAAVDRTPHPSTVYRHDLLGGVIREYRHAA